MHEETETQANKHTVSHLISILPTTLSTSLLLQTQSEHSMRECKFRKKRGIAIFKLQNPCKRRNEQKTQISKQTTKKTATRIHCRGEQQCVSQIFFFF